MDDDTPAACSAASGRPYYYNGFIYGSEIQRGFDVFKAVGSEFAKADRSKVKTLNAQTQFSR